LLPTACVPWRSEFNHRIRSISSRESNVEVERNPEFFNRDLEQKYGLGAGTFFDREHFGEDACQGTPDRNTFI
jgi:hypothetical protein